MHFDEQQRMTKCTVAPPIPRQGMRPSSILCRGLDKMLTFFPRPPRKRAQPKVTLADFLLVEGASPAPGWPLLVRYVDTLCHIHGIPPVPYGLQYADGRPLVEISTGTVVARGAKSIMIELPGCDNTFKVGCHPSAILCLRCAQRCAHQALGIIAQSSPAGGAI